MKLVYAFALVACLSSQVHAELKYSLNGSAAVSVDLQTNAILVGEIQTEATLHIFDDETSNGGAPLLDAAGGTDRALD